jgi:ribosomal protein S18 acetylase RimI-like enzyme
VNTVRLAAAADLEAIAALERDCFLRAWTAGQILAEIDRSPARVWLIEGSAREVLAYAVLRDLAGECELLRLAVLPSRRRHGEARRLLDTVLREAAARGATRCHLEVERVNLAAITLYRQAGFVESGRRPGYYATGDALLFTRELVP